MPSFVKFFFFNLLPFDFSGIYKVKEEDKIYLELKPSFIWDMEEIQERGWNISKFLRDDRSQSVERICPRYQHENRTNSLLKIENLGGYDDTARNKCITATANTALSVHLVLS